MKLLVAIILFVYHSRSSLAASQAVVVNNCSFPVLLQSVQRDVSAVQVLSPGATYAENFKPEIEGTGVAIKVGDATTGTQGAQSILQFEYSYKPGQSPDLFYDISDINNSKPRQFCQYGYKLESDPPVCRTIKCLPDCQNFCPQVYNTPSENYATAGCNSNVNLSLILCNYLQNATEVT